MMVITWSASCVLNRGEVGVSSLCSLSRWSRAVAVLVHFTLVCVCGFQPIVWDVVCSLRFHGGLEEQQRWLWLIGSHSWEPS